MNENIINTTEEVLEVAEEITTPVLPKNNFGKKATVGVLALALVGCAAKFGYDYFKKNKKDKTVEVTNEEENFDVVEDEDFEDTIE